MDNAASFWQNWLARNEAGRDLDLGPFKDMVDRSTLVLKLLEYRLTGAIAAAATTSLPEEVGGERNWDYRFSWVRDSALTVEVLYNVGHLSEMQNYLSWIQKVVFESEADPQVLCDQRGETELTESALDHLEGYKGCRPVRIGNEAYRQRQLDIYGEIMEAALQLSNHVGKIDRKIWPFLSRMCDIVVERCNEKDSGIWEIRGGPYHFVHSKVMCWVALDRAVAIARRYGFPGSLEKWDNVKQEIRQQVFQKG